MPKKRRCWLKLTATTLQSGFSFSIKTRLADFSGGSSLLGRTGVIETPHGRIQTPAFIPVGTKAAMKAVLPEAMEDLGAQALLANAYHLYLQPGADVLDAAGGDNNGGLGHFMNWNKPTFTDSGGFQVMSLGAGFKKVISMDANAADYSEAAGPVFKEKLVRIDEEGVTFKSHLDGSAHRFTPEVSMQVQHKIGADIMFAFDELTTLLHPRVYQEESLERTRRWAARCLSEHFRLTDQRTQKPYQALFGVIQGANYEDLRRRAGRTLGSMGFDGFGIGGALEKQRLGAIIGWVNEELPEDKPRHLLGISEPNDIFVALENGVDTFDCVSPTRVARNSAVYSPTGRFSLRKQRYRTDFNPIFKGCLCYTCRNYTRAYVHHLFRAKEMLGATLASIHNEHFIVGLVDSARRAMSDGSFFAFKEEVLGKYYRG